MSDWDRSQYRKRSGLSSFVYRIGRTVLGFVYAAMRWMNEMPLFVNAATKHEFRFDDTIKSAATKGSKDVDPRRSGSVRSIHRPTATTMCHGTSSSSNNLQMGTTDRRQEEDVRSRCSRSPASKFGVVARLGFELPRSLGVAYV